MSDRPRPLAHFLVALAGPGIWAAHFFGLYLSEALLCATPSSATGGHMRGLGTGLTVAALAALIAVARRHRAGIRFDTCDGTTAAAALSALAGPLAVISMLAVIWSALPLFLLAACAVPPLRPERHTPNSISTLRTMITVALANRLPRCPCCMRKRDEAIS